MASISEFLAKLQYGGARPNKFRVILPFPALTGGAAQTELFSFMCKSSSLPPEDVQPIQVTYQGREFKLPGDRVTQDWSVTVYNDEDFGIRDTFERWSNLLVGHDSNLRNPAAMASSLYSADATVQQLGKTGDVIKEYDMLGIWPMQISDIQLDYGQNGAIEEFQVTFAVMNTSSRTSS